MSESQEDTKEYSDDSEEEEKGSENKTIYVKGFVNSWENKDLAKIFGKFGKIVNISIKRCEKEEFTYAFIEFESPSSTQSALNVNNTVENDCYLLVSERHGKNPEVGTQCKEVYVEGFSMDFTEVDFKQALRKLKHKPLGIKIKESNKEWKRRHAFIQFASIKESASFISDCKYSRLRDSHNNTLTAYYNWPNIYEYIARKEGIPLPKTSKKTTKDQYDWNDS